MSWKNIWIMSENVSSIDQCNFSYNVFLQNPKVCKNCIIKHPYDYPMILILLSTWSIFKSIVHVCKPTCIVLITPRIFLWYSGNSIEQILRILQSVCRYSGNEEGRECVALATCEKMWLLIIQESFTNALNAQYKLMFPPSLIKGWEHFLKLLPI